MWIVVQTGAMGKSHTKAFSQAAHQLGTQERFFCQGLKLPFHPQHCVYEADWSYCSIAPQKIWHSHSLSKYDANHWVRANHRSPQQKILPSQSIWQTKCILRGDQQIHKDHFEKVQEANAYYLGPWLWGIFQKIYLNRDLSKKKKKSWSI